jgi:4-amino-4-deoxy-L-arabinose transferase-like glycosyltransferase
MIGLILRIISSTYNIYSYDFNTFRLPIAQGIIAGNDIYNDLSYNQMPIYPYLTALILLIVGTKYNLLTAVALTLPIAIADYVICVLLYRIGIMKGKEEIGLITSVIYALNPISMHVISQSNWDAFASMFVLLSYYYYLKNRPYFLGTIIGLGFLTKQFPLFFFGFLLISWSDRILDFAKSVLSFTMTTIIILGAVLLPYGTTLMDMVSSLGSHPIIQSESPSPISRIYDLLHLILGISYGDFRYIWAILFLGLYLFSLLIWYRYRSGDLEIELLTVHLTLIAFFFISMHSQFILWTLPWLIWSTFSTKINNSIPFIVMVGYLFRKTDLTIIGDIVLLLAGLYVMIYFLRSIIMSPVGDAQYNSSITDYQK